jgi:hypothetical protein
LDQTPRPHDPVSLRSLWPYSAPAFSGTVSSTGPVPGISLARRLSSTASAADLLSLVRSLFRYYAAARLLPGVHARITLLASRTDPATCTGTGCRRGLSVLERAVSRRADGSWTTPGLTKTRAVASASVAFPLGTFGRRPEFVFRSSIPRPSMPLSTLHLVPRGTRRKTRGQDGSLLLSCGELASPTARRFIPTLALPYGRGSDARSEPRP